MIRLALALAAFLLLPAHDWYTDTKTIGTGYPCCGGNDCIPVVATPVDGGWVYPHPFLPDHPPVFVPIDGAQMSRDGQYHACHFPTTDPKNRCFFVPLTG